MTEAEFSFAMETEGLTLLAAFASGFACLIVGTVASIHWTSRHRPPGKGWLTIGGLMISAAALFLIAFEFWRLP